MSNNIVLGIDVSKNTLSLAIRFESSKFYEKVVSNSISGFESILKILDQKMINKECKKCVMESTGNYSESIADYLYDNGFDVKVVNPYKIAAFSKSKLYGNRILEKHYIYQL